MPIPQDYRPGKPLVSSRDSEVFSGWRERDEREVRIKRFLEDRGPHGRSRAQLEFDALRAAAGTGVPEALEVTTGAEGPVLVTAHVPGIPLAAWLGANTTSDVQFVELALQLSEVLARVHDARFVHRKVSPASIWIDPATLKTHLIDFSLARPLGSAGANAEVREQPELRSGTLAYISPEQTGRMDRGVDSRSDLYSLGTVLYHALTGRPPFESLDALSLIHAHMAKLPTNVAELRPSASSTLARIVTRLLQKSPEERYQTARALQADLLECRQQLERTGAIQEDLPLGTADAPYRPLFSRRLYGREAEVRVLHEAYARAAAGSATVLFLAGAPGIGKSVLVHELRMPLTQSRGHLAQGKFDLYRREQPYSGFLQALESFTQQILTESDTDLARWRSELSTALGGIARVLVDLVPDLGVVLGETPPVPALGPTETRARLSLALRRFVQAAAVPDHPLVLFLDDVHWADSGSRELLRDLLLQSTSCALLALGAYRDNEVDSSHPLRTLIAELTERGRSLATIQLGPLPEEACVQMLAAALGRSPDETRPLAACVARKTGNAPLIIQQFVQHMYDLGLIRFRPGLGWDWDDASVADAGIPDDAVALMAAKIERLEETERAVIKLASCIADHFDVEALTELSDLSLDAVQPALYRLADEGLLAPSSSGFRFVHDRIREAAQSLWPDAERRQFHARAGRRLLERTAEEALDDQLVEILDHLNRAPDLIADESERIQRIELNLRAGRRTLAAGAAAAAESFLSAARALFHDSDWTRDPSTSFELHAQSADCAYSSRSYEAALGFLDVLERRPEPTPIELARTVARRTSIYALTRTPREAVEVGLGGLARLGFRWPAEPSRMRLTLLTLRSLWVLRRLKEGDLGPLNSRNPHWFPVLLIVLELIGPAYRTSWKLQSLIGHLCIWNSLRWGTLAPAFTVTGPSTTLAYDTGNYTRGSRHGDLALRNLELNPRQPAFYRARMSVFAFIKAFVMPRGIIMAEMQRAREDALEHGDVSFALYAELLRGSLMWVGGEPLSTCVRSRQEFLELSRDLSYPDLRSTEHMLAVFAALTGSGSSTPSAEIRAELVSSPLYLPMRSAWMFCQVLLGDARLAFDDSESMLPEVTRVYCNLVYVPQFWLSRGLSAASLASTARGRHRAHYVRALRHSCRLLHGWARHGPVNFEAAMLLLDAERARLAGQHPRALELSRKAAESARTHDLPHHEALAHERHARVLQELRRETEATTSLQRAAKLYDTWGAAVPAARLRQECGLPR